MTLLNIIHSRLVIVALDCFIFVVKPTLGVVAAPVMKNRSTIFLYEGEGAGSKSLHMLKVSVEQMADMRFHDVRTISPEEIQKGEWRSEAVLIALGGGYDRGYLNALGDEGQNQIRQFVSEGGSYLGFCAGGYFGGDFVVFDEGGPQEVVGPRNLYFFPGRVVGPVFGEFDYFSESGSRAALVSWELSNVPDLFVYFNGGGMFMPHATAKSQAKVQGLSIDESPSSTMKEDEYISINSPSLPRVRSWEVMSRYLQVEGNPPAAVKCQVGKGRAILTGIHPEFQPWLMDQRDPLLIDKLPALKASDRKRCKAMQSILEYLGVHTLGHKVNKL